MKATKRKIKKAEGIDAGIRINGLCLKIRDYLIISDIHLGYEHALTSQGVLIPPMQYNEIEKMLKSVIGNKHFNSIVLNGDFKHDFGRINSSEWRHALKLLNFLAKHCRKIIIIKGNHDRAIEPLVKNNQQVELKDHEFIDGVYICHGDKIPDNSDFKRASHIIIGHEHPAIALKEGIRTEIYKCFLAGKWRNKQLIVMPSFNPLVEGANIINEKPISPFLKGNLSDFEVIVANEKEGHYFGKIKDIIKLYNEYKYQD